MHVFDYDPERFILKWGPIVPTGYASGSMMLVEPDDPKRYKRNIGAKGEVSRSRVPNRSTTVKIRLKHTSPSNRDLYLGMATGIKRPLSIVEIEGGAFVYSAAEAWIEEPPKPDIGAEEGVNEFMFGTGPAQYGQTGAIFAL